jgi:hypothetical protein
MPTEIIGENDEDVGFAYVCGKAIRAMSAKEQAGRPCCEDSIYGEIPILRL